MKGLAMFWLAVVQCPLVVKVMSTFGVLGGADPPTQLSGVDQLLLPVMLPWDRPPSQTNWAGAAGDRASRAARATEVRNTVIVRPLFMASAVEAAVRR